jgi:hypothetical protein
MACWGAEVLFGTSHLDPELCWAWWVSLRCYLGPPLKVGRPVIECVKSGTSAALLSCLGRTSKWVQSSLALHLCVCVSPQVDVDGRPDVVACGPSDIQWYRNLGGTPVSWTMARIGTPASSSLANLIQAADLDLDGLYDIVRWGGWLACRLQRC